MNQKVLTTFSIISINYQDVEDKYSLMSRSIIRDEMFLSCQHSEKDFESSLFYVQVDGNNQQFKSTIQFGQKVIFRHKLSNKYLSHSEEFEEEENDTTYKLKLSHQKHFFKIMPCFQYQTKISNKIRFNEDVHIVTEISGARIGYLSSQRTHQPHIRKTLIGMNYTSFLNTSKFSFHCYYEASKQQIYYTYGSIIWLSHIESSTFMSAKKIQQKKQLVFENIEYDKDLQSISGLWLIESENTESGGKLDFQEKFRLKNLSQGLYMSFSKNYKMNQNERVYNMILEEVPSEKSQFIFKSLKGQQTKVKKGSYLIFQHYESGLFIGCRKTNFFPNTEIIKPISSSIFSDQDLYKIIELDENEEEAIRFILSINQQIQFVENGLDGMDLSEKKLEEDKQIFLNIKKELQKLRLFETLFQKVQGQTGVYIEYFAILISKYRKKMSSHRKFVGIITQIMKIIYAILVIICYQHRKNQQQSYLCIHHYVDDIFTGMGQLNILIETFKNNYGILCKVPHPMPNLGGKNIMRVALEMVQRFSHNKNNEYWQKINKFIEFLRILIFNGQGSIDINQRLISEEFFGEQNSFRKIFFDIKVINHRIKVEQQPTQYVEIERIRNPFLITIIEQVFKLFSFLCSNRNFISKKYINLFLTSATQHGLEVLIAYLSMPISERMSNSLYSLITNLYIDSSPRIDRQKPLSVINFAITAEKRGEEQIQMSERLKSALLYKLQDSYSSRPLQISNLLNIGLKMSMEPSLNHDELALYKEQLNQRMWRNKKVISSDLLRSIKFLISLQSYNEGQIIQIYKGLRQKLKQPNLSYQILIGIMKIIQQICKYCRQVELKKMTAYLKYKYRIKQHTINYSKDIQFVLPYARRITPSERYPKDINQSIATYNKYSNILAELEPDNEIKNILLSLLLNEKNKNTQKNPKNVMKTEYEQAFLSEVYTCFQLLNFPKKQFLKFLMNSIVVTNQQVEVFEKLFDLYKKLKHLNAISEYWLCSEGQNQNNLKSFIRYMVDVTQHFHEGYENKQTDSQREFKMLNDYTSQIIRPNEVYVNRQLLLRNIGFHQIILELLQSNFYLLQINAKQADPRAPKSRQLIKIQQVFSLCFQFIYGFIYNCNQTKSIIHKAWGVFDKYQRLPEVGQTHVYIQFYKNKIQYIREIKKSFIERIINKIVKNPRSNNNDGCEFNPESLSYLQAIISINGEPYRPNLQTVYRSIEKPNIFKKIMFGQEIQNRKIRLCLNMFQIKTDCVQVPFLYHVKIFKILNQMVLSLDSQSTILKSKLRNLFDFNDFLQILYGKDIYTHKGSEASMNFLLKREIIKIAISFLDRNDSISLLQDNDHVLELLNFYYKVFVGRVKKINDEAMNETLYEPYLQQYTETLKYFLNNERTYFKTEIVPFLKKIQEIFIRAKKNVNNPVCLKINNILQMADPTKMTEFFQYRKQGGNNIDKVSFRWLNFVDKDQDNSPQQKFAKFTVIEILRNHIVEKKIIQENQNFFNKLLHKKNIDFIEVLMKLLKTNMEGEYIESESQQNNQELRQILIILRTLITNITEKAIKNQLALFLIDHNIGQLFISYCCKIEFDFSKLMIRKIFHQILKIFIFIMKTNEDQKFLKGLYSIFNDNPLGYRFWSHLNESILLISTAMEFNQMHDQINWCLKNIYLIPEQKSQNIYEQALQFLQNLCQYYPFTKLLRYQSTSPSWDFLQVVHHSLTFIIMPNNQLKINVIRVEGAELLMKTISAFMFGGNQSNQNYIIDNKFPQMITEILKVQSYDRDMDMKIVAQRDRLVNQVIQFYKSNGIDLEKDIRRKIRLLDFNHIYILNRLKYKVLECLMNCIHANQLVANKIKFKIPIEILKINLIWVYEDFKQEGFKYTEQNILKPLEKWEDASENPKLSSSFLKAGFYLYYLLSSREAEKEEQNDEEDGLVDQKQKSKQKLVKKFFHTISQKDRKKQKMQKLQNQPFAEEMIKFYEEYYTALEFFKQKTLSIELNFYNRLTKINFVKIPLCDKMTDEMINDFKQDAVRISQEEKIKSLLEFEEESYNYLQGEQDFFKKFENITVFYWLLRNVLNEDKLRLVSLISCFIQTILFFIQNYIDPSFLFSHNMLIDTHSTLEVIMMIFGILNLIIGFFMAFYLFFKKLPVLLRIQLIRQKNRNQKQRNKTLNGKYMFILKRVFRQTIFIFLYIGFLIASFIHPFFAGWILFDVMNRLTVGRQIIRSVSQTWAQLFGAIGLLIVINYLYSVYVYVQFTPFYSPACQQIYQCLLLLLDQSLKSDSGFLGSTPIQYGQNEVDLKFISEMLYIIFAQKIIFEIFSGIIIDKFSQLREEQQDQQDDQNTMCYICGQERFVIDFQLEGFEQHICNTHNAMSYVFYLYYLKRKNPRSYNIVDRYVNECREKQKKNWIPNETSILKIFKEKENVVEEDENNLEKMKQYLDKKTQDVKQARIKGELIISELRQKLSNKPI